MASTNKTTNYELSQYVGTDKPTYLGDYNSDMSKIDTAIHGVAQNVGTESARINIVENDIGTMANLQTTDKSSLVGAINEVNTNANTNSTNIGTLTNLETTDKTTIVNAINEIVDFDNSFTWNYLGQVTGQRVTLQLPQTWNEVYIITDLPDNLIIYCHIIKPAVDVMSTTTIDNIEACIIGGSATPISGTSSASVVHAGEYIYDKTNNKIGGNYFPGYTNDAINHIFYR